MSDTQYQTQSEATRTEKGEVEYWLREIQLADKREKKWREIGEKATSIYEAEKKKEHPFNILFSNTETISPVLYSLPPRPVVKRRYLDRDPVGAAGAKTIQRMLEYQADTNEEEYDNFDELMKSVLLQALVPGRGVIWWKYDAEVTEAVEKSEGEEGEAIEGLDAGVQGEKVVGEVVEWTRFRHGFARSWNKVPWVCREHTMNLDELKANFGDSKAKQVQLTGEDEDNEDSASRRNQSENSGSLQSATVYEVWDKTTKRIIFLSPECKDVLLKTVEEDPHGLEGFFPCSRPLQFLRRIKRLEPMCPYSTYEEQAEELNKISVRITKIIQALKVRGFYDATIEGLDQVLEADDNKLIPADNVASMQQGRKLDDAIWLMPIEKLIAVLQQLYVQREQVKQVIYEIMGIADIMRGASQASETATAQNLKSQWGGMRVKRWQGVMASYVRDNLRILASLSATHLSVELIKQMTGLPFVMPEEKQQAQQMLQQAQGLMQQAQAMQSAGLPPPPELQQALQQLQPQVQQAQQVANAIDWGQVKEVISNSTLRNFRVDIETNSTLDSEATEDKQNVSELLMAISQYFQSVGPLIQSNVFPFDMAKQMLLTMVRRFKFGGDVEEQLESMQQPPPPQGGPEAQQLLEERQKFEEEKQKAQQDFEKQKQQLADLQRELEFTKREMEMEMKFQQREADMEREFAKRGLLQEVQQAHKEQQLQLSNTINQATTSLKGEGQRQEQAMRNHAKTVQAASKAKPDNSGQLQQLTATLDSIAKLMASPRQIIRGPDGKALRAELIQEVQNA